MSRGTRRLPGHARTATEGEPSRAITPCRAARLPSRSPRPPSLSSCRDSARAPTASQLSPPLARPDYPNPLQVRPPSLLLFLRSRATRILGLRSLLREPPGGAPPPPPDPRPASKLKLANFSPLSRHGRALKKLLLPALAAHHMFDGIAARSRCTWYACVCARFSFGPVQHGSLVGSTML